MFRDGGVAVAEDPPFVETGGAFFAHLLGDFVEGFGAAGGHGEDHGQLLLRQVAGAEGVDAARVVGGVHGESAVMPGHGSDLRLAPE